MFSKKRLSKFKLLTGFLGIGAISGIAAIVASCAQPNAATVNNLFKKGNNFSNLNNLNNNDLVALALDQKDGFNSFLSAAVANVLKVWYENNPDSKVKDKLKNWNNEIDKSWDTQAQSYRDQYRQDYQVKLQTDILDGAGGSEASWKNNQLNSKILSDFSNLLYSGDYLRYVDADGNIITQPDPSALAISANWSNLKYTNKTVNSPLYTENPSVANNKEMFAEIQGFIFNQWVKEQNPNLLSRVVFTNETPKKGFASIFNDQLISSPSASYEFQFFNPTNPMDPNLSASSSYQTMVGGLDGKGLSRYVNDYKIDIPKKYSGDSGGKLLMTADDMFNSYDLSFTAGFVDQYLKMLGYDNLITWPTGTPDPDSIMKNFIRDTSTNPNVVSTKLDYLTQKNFENNDSNFFSSQIDAENSFYEGLWPSSTSPTSEPTKSIYNVFSPESSGTPANDDNQFIFVRGKDGVHIMAIDGGKYYLNLKDSSSKETHQRDIKRQEQFLMFRSLYRTLNYVKDPQLDYSFNATTQSQNWFQKNEAMLIYEAFANALNDKNSYLNIASNSALKSAFENLYNTVNSYVNAADQYFEILNYSNDVNTIRSKIYDFSKTYIDNDKNKNSANNGIASKFPNKSAKDGSYPSLEEYYALLIQDPNPTSSSPTILDQTSGSRIWFNIQLDSAKSKLQKQALTLAKSLNLTSVTVSDYSQNILLKSNIDDSYSLGINLAINSTISSNDISNKIKLAYFLNSDLFNNFYDPSTSSIKSTYPNASDIQAPLQNYYNILQWIALDNKGAYGVPDTMGSSSAPITDDKKVENFESILNNVFKDQNINANSYDDNTLNYYTYLYTFAWLINDNFAQFKSILNSQIVQGVNGIISWSVPVPVNFSDYTTNDPLSTFPNNPNFIWGAPTNWNNQFNGIDQGNLSNDLANPYIYTETTTASNHHYGFNGLSLNDDPKINSSLSSTFFSNFNNSKLKDPTTGLAQKYSIGSLYAYGSSAVEVENYVNQMSSIRELNSFIQYLLSTAGFVVDPKAPYFNDLQQSNNNFESKQAAIIKLISDLDSTDPYVFEQYQGYIGQNKSTSLTDLKPTISSDAKQQLPAYVIQVNFDDVNKIGADSLTNKADSLGLDPYAFLTIIAMQAADSATQNNAISYLINNSNVSGTLGQKITIGDNRLYNSLTSRWANN